MMQEILVIFFNFAGWKVENRKKSLGFGENCTQMTQIRRITTDFFTNIRQMVDLFHATIEMHLLETKQYLPPSLIQSRIYPSPNR